MSSTQNLGQFPSPDVEGWLCRKLGDATLLCGDTTPEIRRERIRERILRDGRQRDVAGRRASDGRLETFGELFQRLYGEKLETATNRRR